jgi:hypothetical protein
MVPGWSKNLIRGGGLVALVGLAVALYWYADGYPSASR